MATAAQLLAAMKPKKQFANPQAVMTGNQGVAPPGKGGGALGGNDPGVGNIKTFGPSGSGGSGGSGGGGPSAFEAYLEKMRASTTPFANKEFYPDDELSQLPGSPNYKPFDPTAPGIKQGETVTVGENEIVHGPLPPGSEYTKPPVYNEGDLNTYTGTGSYNGQEKKLTCGPNQYFAQGPTGPMCLSKKNYGDPANAKAGNYNVLEYGKSIDGGGDQEAVYKQMATSAINSGLDINTLAQQAGVTYEQAKQFLETYG